MILVSALNSKRASPAAATQSLMIRADCRGRMCRRWCPPIALALCFALPAHAATLTIPQAAVTLTIQNAIDCNDGSALVCITTLAQRREYLLSIPDNGAFVAAAYRILLYRAADVPGLGYYTNRLIGNTITRDGVIAELMASNEYRVLHP
jgi:Domain of unknown function (DUF4214)